MCWNGLCQVLGYCKICVGLTGGDRYPGFDLQSVWVVSLGSPTAYNGTTLQIPRRTSLTQSHLTLMVPPRSASRVLPNSRKSPYHPFVTAVPVRSWKSSLAWTGSSDARLARFTGRRSKPAALHMAAGQRPPLHTDTRLQTCCLRWSSQAS